MSLSTTSPEPPVPAQAAPPEPLRQIPNWVWVLAAGLLGLLYYIYRVPLAQMVHRWEGSESYYSHGYLVPFIALYLLWRTRGELVAAPRRAFWPGLVTLVAGLLLFVVAGFFSVFFLGALAFVITLWGIGGLLLGYRFMRLTLFPAFVLLFMVPLPMVHIEGISLKLKLFAAHAATALMQPMGIMAINDGSVIYLNDAVVTVGAACSGLRSLISLIFLGVLFAYLVNLTFPRKVLLFFASMPIAIVANIVRVVILAVVANEYGTEYIREGTIVHDGSGYLIFVVAFALLYGTVKLLSMWGGTLPNPVPAGAGTATPPEATPDGPVPPANGNGNAYGGNGHAAPVNTMNPPAKEPANV